VSWGHPMSAVSAGDFRGLVLGAPIPVEGRVGGEITSFRKGSRPWYSGPQVTDSPDIYLAPAQLVASLRHRVAPRASRSSPVPFSRKAGVSAPSRNTPCSVKVSVVPDDAGENSTVVTETEINVSSAVMT
jgi:hypothetical protein